MRSLHGMHVHGFPNLFIVGPGQGANLISNVTHNLTEAGHDRRDRRHALDHRATGAGGGDAEAEHAWVDLLESNPGRFSATRTARPATTTTRAARWDRKERLNASGYPDGPVAYFALIDRWRTSGSFDGLAFRAPGSAPLGGGATTAHEPG
jgi:hypothetical protein